MNEDQRRMTSLRPIRIEAKDGRPVTIRVAEPVDRAHITANIHAICSEAVFLQTDAFVATRAWDTALCDSENPGKGRLLLLSTVGDDVIGHLRLFCGGYGEKDRHVGSVGVALLRPYREIGIGSALLAEALNWAPRASFEKIEAYVIASNLRARRLFEKFDFDVESVRRQQLKIKGEYVDELIYTRPMPAASRSA